jgi:hypothetical protein
LRDSKKEKNRDFSEKLNLVVSFLGTAKIMFSFLFFFSLITYHREISKEILIISMTYLIFIIQSPIDYIYLLVNKINQKRKFEKNIIGSGEITAYKEPDIVLIKLETEVDIPYMTGIILKDQYSLPKIGVSLDYTGKADGVLLRTNLLKKIENTTVLNDINAMPLNSVIFVTNEYLSKNDISINCNKIIGLVSTDTSNDFMSFEIILDEEMEVGTLVSTEIQKKK